jgi:hypothetical protein
MKCSESETAFSSRNLGNTRNFVRRCNLATREQTEKQQQTDCLNTDSARLQAGQAFLRGEFGRANTPMMPHDLHTMPGPRARESEKASSYWHDKTRRVQTD